MANEDGSGQATKSCATCGFLCAEHRPYGRLTVCPARHEIAQDARDCGALFQIGIKENQLSDNCKPACACNRRDIARDIEDDRKERGLDASQQKDGAREVIERPIECDEWFEYHPGYGPEKHLELRDMLQIEGLRTDMANRDRENRTRTDRQFLRLAVMQVIAGVLSLFVGVTAIVIALRQQPPAVHVHVDETPTSIGVMPPDPPPESAP